MITKNGTRRREFREWFYVIIGNVATDNFTHCICMYSVHDCILTMLIKSIASQHDWKQRNGVYLVEKNAISIQLS